MLHLNSLLFICMDCVFFLLVQKAGFENTVSGYCGNSADHTSERAGGRCWTFTHHTQLLLSRHEQLFFAFVELTCSFYAFFSTVCVTECGHSNSVFRDYTSYIVFAM